MAKQNENGTIEKTVLEKTYEETQIEWKIPDFITLAETKGLNASCYSPVFCVNNVQWHFYFSVRNYFMRQYQLFLTSNELPEGYSAQYKLNFNVSDRCTEGKIIRTPGRKNAFIDVSEFMLSELLNRKSELAFMNRRIIILTVKREITCSIKPSASDKAIQNNLIKLDKLSENFKDLFGDKETCDMTLKVKDKEYKVHRYVLIARSSVFAANFKCDTMERQTGVITIPDCDPDSFEMLLEYLYSGKLEELSSLSSALNLYYTSDKYDIQDVKTFCVECLKKHLTVESVCEVVAFADQYDETELFTAVQNFFNSNATAILESPEWECLLKKDYRLANTLMIEMSKVKN